MRHPIWVLLYVFIATELIFTLYFHYYIIKSRRAKVLLYILQSVFILLLVYAFTGVFGEGDNSAFIRHFKNGMFILALGKAITALFFLLNILRGLIKFIYGKYLAKPFLPQKSTPSLNDLPAMSRSRFIETIGIGSAALCSGLLFYGWSNKYNYKIYQQRLLLKSLPADFRGLRIVQISDIHAGSFTNHQAVARGVDLIMQQGADVIFFTGDLVNNRYEEMLPYIDIFSQLRAPLGVYSILGNHDYGDYVQWENEDSKLQNLASLKDLHRHMGWRLLLNEHIFLRKGESKIALIGVENWSAVRRFSRHGDLHKAMQGLSADSFKILLSHDPTHWDTQVLGKKPIQLTFSGHTHGMQLGVEIPFFKWSPAKFMFPHWAGLYEEKQQFLYVNRGFGFIGYQGRLGIMPEISVIDLI